MTDDVFDMEFRPIIERDEIPSNVRMKNLLVLTETSRIELVFIDLLAMIGWMRIEPPSSIEVEYYAVRQFCFLLTSC